MKKIITSVLVTLSSIAFSTVPAMAQANINNTGPGSNNTITNNSATTCTSVSSNSAIVSNTTSQSSSSGGANVSGNTSGGSATSGSSSNNSSTNTQLSFTNGNPCVPSVSLPVGGSGGNGGGSGGGAAQTAAALTLAGGQGASAELVSSLPDTGPVAPAEQVLAGSALLSGLVMVGAVLRKLFGDAA